MTPARPPKAHVHARPKEHTHARRASPAKSRTPARTQTPARPKTAAKASSQAQVHAQPKTKALPEDTRERLIECASRLFSQKGFDAVSVKELAEAADVNVSLVSYHFGGKESLYRTCLEQFGMARLNSAQRVLQPPQTLDEFRFRLKMFFEELVTCHLESGGVAEIIHRDCEMDMSIAPDIFKNTFLKVFDTIVSFFISAQKSGLLRKELDPLLTAQFVFGSLMHTVHKDKIAQRFFGLTIADPEYRQRVIDNVIHCSIYGIATDRSKTS